MTQKAKRVTVFYDEQRGWLFKVQGANWHTIYKTPVGWATQNMAVKSASRRYPDAEIVVESIAV